VHSVYNLAKGYGVDTFSKGFDDMGGLTFNLLNVSTIARLLGADTETANNMSLGLFELQITTKGAASRFGTNGIDVSGMLYDLGKWGVDSIVKHNEAKKQQDVLLPKTTLELK